MKTISTKILSGAMLLGGMLFASCQRTGVDASGLVNPIDARDGSFTIVGNLSDYQTRAHDAVWDAGDQIGVFAFTAGTSNLFNNFANVQYNTVDAAGVFKAANGGVVLKGTEKADIAAYYPYASGLRGNTYVVNVSDQSDLKKLDLLWGKGTLTADATTQTVPVKFAHKLSLIQVRFTPKAGETLPASIKTSLKGVKTAATFDVASGAFTLGETTGDVTLPAKDGAVNLILLPGDVLSGLEFDFDGKVVPFKFDAPYTLKENTKYTFTFTPTKDLKSVTLQVDGSSISDWGSEVTFEGEVPYGDVVDPGTPEPENPGTTEPETPTTASPLFAGSDFEDWAILEKNVVAKFGIKDIVAAPGEGRNGTQAAALRVAPGGNNYLFTAVLSENLKSTPKKISFYIKGTGPESLSMNVFVGGGTQYAVFNLDSTDVDGSKSELTLAQEDKNSYEKKGINTNGKWVKIILDLSTVTKGVVNTQAGQQILSIKDGSNTTAYDLLIDDITYE